MEKKKIAQAMSEKLEYICLDLEQIPETLKYVENINFKPNIGIEENKYRQYRFVSPKELEILLSPCNRLEDTKTKYSKAKPLVSYLDPKTEEEKELHKEFLRMLEEVDIDEIKQIEEQQQLLNKKIPFKVRYPKNYLWQIYYSEIDDKYFMIVTTEDQDYSTFFYVLKKQLEKKKAGKIYVPINNIDYSKEILNKTEIESLENYLWTFTNDWPSIYEVYDKTGKVSLQIIGQTQILGTIKSEYKEKLTGKIDASKFFKLVKALYILQTEIPEYYKFEVQIDKQGELEFYYKDEVLKYDDLPDFINNQYKKLIDIEEENIKNNIEYQKKLEILRKETEKLEADYIEKEKQISTFLECKKTFFGKVKYFFKYSGKKKKKELKKEIEEKENNITPEVTEIEEEEKIKRQYTLDDLLEKGKEAAEREKEFNNTKMDINAIKLKKVNLAKKIENASAFIAEIDSHKKSIFEFWKYSNKDEVKSLAEGEEEIVNVKPHAKTFDFEEDFEEFGSMMDQIQRNKLNKEELDSVFLAATEQIEPINKVKTNSLEPKELDKYLKLLKAEQKEQKGKLDDEIDIFGGLEEDTRKIKKLDNKSHRENPKNKFLILGLAKQYKVVDYKVNLSQTIWRINEAINKITTSQEIVAYMWTEDGESIDANKINIFNLNAEDEIKKAIEKSENSKLNLYKIKLEKGSNVIAFSNCIYYDNQNKTLPIGMDNDTRIIAKLSDMDIKLESKKVIKIGKLDYEEMGTKLIVKNINILEYTVKQMEEE